MKPAQILIIDKTGFIGEPLSIKLSKEFSVVFVSKKPSAHISFSRKFPLIPDNKYSHMIVIAGESEDLEFLSSIIEKAKGVNSDLIFAKDISSKDNYAEKVLNAYPTGKVVLYGDIFDNKLIYRYEGFKSVINKFIYQAQRFGKIQIVGNGLRETYPVFVSDVVDRIIDLVFGINDKHSLFYLFPKHPVTELSLAHMIQKANPEVTIDFISHGSRKEIISYPPHGKYLLDDKYPIAKKIRAVDIDRKITNEGKTSSETKYKVKKGFFSKILWVFVFLIASPLFFTLFFSFAGLNTLYYAKTMIDKGNFNTAKSSFHLSNTLFSIGKQTSGLLFFQGKIIGKEESLKRLLEDIDLGQRISQAGSQVFNSENYFAKVFIGKSKNPKEDFTKGQNDLKNAIVALERIRAEGKMPALFLEKIKSIDPLIKLLSNTSDLLPGIFGLEGQRTYLMLFQNNMELRPGGGFIGSYGILKLNKGKITDFSIHDVYDADGQLRGHVEPPFAIRRYLPSAHWYMRDSNFDVDFVKSALASSNFLNVETGQKVSGVIGVDVSFVKNILHAIGPVYVPDYKETVDQNNLYMLTQTHSEKNFFPGSTQKKDFLRSLYKAMQVKLASGDIPYFSLAKALSDSLSQKHLIFAFNNNTQNVFTVNGWSSSLWDERREDEKAVNDFLGINEANLGVNKVNYFIVREVTHKVKIEDSGKVLEELNISYKNASTSWPGGDYKNYLRIILPKETAISEISINDISQVLVDAVTDFQIYEAKDFKPPIGLEIEKVNQDNKTIYGFIVKVPVGEVVKVKAQYTLAKKVVDLNAFSYNLRLFKQPGIDSFPYSFSLVYPVNFNVTNMSEGISKQEGKVSFFKKIAEDRDLIINFARK